MAKGSYVDPEHTGLSVRAYGLYSRTADRSPAVPEFLTSGLRVYKHPTQAETSITPKPSEASEIPSNSFQDRMSSTTSGNQSTAGSYAPWPASLTSGPVKPSLTGTAPLSVFGPSGPRTVRTEEDRKWAAYEPFRKDKLTSFADISASRK